MSVPCLCHNPPQVEVPEDVIARARKKLAQIVTDSVTLAELENGKTLIQESQAGSIYYNMVEGKLYVKLYDPLKWIKVNVSVPVS